jgi:choline dehydrogenase-like flavoprotein
VIHSVLDRNPLLSFYYFSDGKHSTVIESDRDEQLDRPISLIAGQGLGGTTRINSAMFTLGVPAEYNAWAQAGAEGWSYEDLKPYLKKSETWVGPVTREFHGTDGVLSCALFLRTVVTRIFSILRSASSALV